jgi:hypothetical protein
LAEADGETLPTHESDASHAYYERLDAHRFTALRATESPWDTRLQHGGPPTALLARVMLDDHPRDDMRLARITADFLGPIPRDVVDIHTRVVRAGKRIELIEGTMTSGGRDAVVARAWRIIVGAPGSVPPAPTPQDTPPARGPAVEPPQWLRGWGYGESIEWRYTTADETFGPKAAWARLRGPLVTGEPLQPLDRALVLADSANGISGELPMAEWLFVPPSLTVALERYPRGDWALLEARTTLTDDGIGACVARLADDDGYLGHTLQSLVVQRHS